MRMDWSEHFNYSSLGNESQYDFEFRDWPRSFYQMNYFLDVPFVKHNHVIWAIFTEMFKSMVVTLISLAGISRIKSPSIRSKIIFILESLFVLLFAAIFYVLLTASLIPFVLYRLVVSVYFSLLRPSCKLMHGTDSFWCMDTEEAKSIINILLLVEVKETDTDILKKVLEVMTKLCTDPVYGFKFISHRKKSNFGYYYWERASLIDVQNNVNYIQDQIRNRDDLQVYLNRTVNKNVDGVGWEVLISKNDLDSTNVRPVIFRMHHSIGDGLSILNALMNSISDKTNGKINVHSSCNISGYQGVANLKYHYKPKSVPINIRTNKLIHMIKLNMIAVPSFITGPINFAKQIYSENETSNLTVDQLTGDKVILWYNDDEILRNIKMIRKKFKSSFSEAVFALFSNSIQRYLERKNQIVSNINVVVPVFNNDSRNVKIKSEIINESNNVKISKLEEIGSGMSNSFWVGMLRLPIEIGRSKMLKDKIERIKLRTEMLKKSPDYIMYKFLLSVIVTVVPGTLVKPMFDIIRSHMVFSNLPGPQNEIRIAGNAVKEICFWLPNRGTTGLGLSLLSNNNRLSIGLIADVAVVPTRQDLQTIMEDFIQSAHKECH